MSYKCETCNNNYYVENLNSENNITEIQRCDECAVFASDTEARKKIINEEVVNGKQT